jgi:hypothetical protein
MSSEQQVTASVRPAAMAPGFGPAADAGSHSPQEDDREHEDMQEPSAPSGSNAIPDDPAAGTKRPVSTNFYFPSSSATG